MRLHRLQGAWTFLSNRCFGAGYSGYEDTARLPRERVTYSYQPERSYRFYWQGLIEMGALITS